MRTPLTPDVAVHLKGGPMAGWVVKLDAPVLRADWYETLPPHLKAKWAPGRYHVAGNKRVATWKAVDLRQGTA